MLITMKYLTVVLIVLFSESCTPRPEKREEKPLARVYNQYLYPSDIQDVLPTDLGPADSAAVVKDFIEKWVRNQLVLNKAETNLTESEKDVELLIESYRSSLLIYAYQQSYLRQKLDTVVTDKEITDYYNHNGPNFILGNSLIKGIFIKVPVNAPEIWKLRQWYRSNDPESIKNLEAYCYNHAKEYTDFQENWVKLSEVLQKIPSSAASSEDNFLARKYLEIRDQQYYYFIQAKEIAPEGTVSPLELVKSDIQYILMNKRKILLINELESNIYSDAQNHDHFTIYQQ